MYGYLSDFEQSRDTTEQVNQIVNQAIGDIQFPEGVTQSQVTEIVNQAIAGIEFPEIDTLSTDEVQSIVNTAISGIEFPEGVTSDQVLDIIQTQLEAQPEGLTSDDVNQIVSTAISNIQFPASVTQEEVTDLLGEVEDTLSSSLESYQEGVQEDGAAVPPRPAQRRVGRGEGRDGDQVQGARRGV